MHRFILVGGLTTALFAGAGCSATQPPVKHAEPAADPVEETVEAPPERESAPTSGPVREIHFPSIVRSAASNGLELNLVPMPDLPVVQVGLVIKSGKAADPQGMPGMAHLMSAMLKEGTARRTSAQLAEDVEFLGARLRVHHDEENIYIEMHALSEHLEQALAIIGEMATQPRFDVGELKKLKSRELDRLALRANDPHFLASRAFFGALYGEHPYAHVDTTPDVVKKVQRNDLVRWHRAHFLPNNAFLTVVGDTDAERVQTAVESTFKRWKPGTLPSRDYPEPPARDRRQVILVDRPDSVQSVIYLGNLTIPRNHEDYVPLLVANQVLGGSAASRLFMDLREQRSLTYGAYSRVLESVQKAPFRAYAAVRNDVTGEAMQAFTEHLERITQELPDDDELINAQRFLVDSFPLRIDTTSKIANLVQDLRIYGLDDGYWDTFRQEIGNVTAEQARAAARAHIRNDQLAIVVVGRAADIAPVLAAYGELKVVDVRGNPLPTPEAAAAKGAASDTAADKVAADKVAADKPATDTPAADESATDNVTEQGKRDTEPGAT